MTSITPEYFEHKAQEQKKRCEELMAWCAENKAVTLTDWMQENGYESYDLFAIGLFSYEKYNISSMPNLISLSGAGANLIGTPPGLFGNYHEDLELFYVLDEMSLRKQLMRLDSRSEHERISDYAREYEAKYGSEPELPDEYTPFEQRTYVVGPYCDLDTIAVVRQIDVPHSDLFCNWCGKFLFQKPSFTIAKAVLCYGCAKLAFEQLDSVTEALNSVFEQEAIQSVLDAQRWEADFRCYKRSKSLLTKLSDLFNGNDGSYVQQYIDQNPKPSLIEFQKIAPDIRIFEPRYERTIVNRMRVLKRDYNTCQRCGIGFVKGAEKELEAHHVLPKSRGGKDYDTNMITLCIGCHDAETWFGHRRAYKSWGEAYSARWEWELKPDLLMMSSEELLELRTFFAPIK